MRYLFLSLIIILALISIAAAGYKEDFEKEFLTKTWAGAQAEESVCVDCHASEKMTESFKTIPESAQTSVHYLNNVSCHNCHGGDSKDAAMAMSHTRGFVGTPKYAEVPEFCGKCHVGILKNYLESGHGKALKSTGKGPNCVTCHGSHKEGRYIQKASIDIINEQQCTKCHSYDRAKIMKQAIFLTEKKIGELDDSLNKLRADGIFVDEEEQSLFSTHVQFRTLFHTVDVALVKQKTDDFAAKLNLIEKKIKDTVNEIKFRKNFSAFLMLLFACMSIVLYINSKISKD